MPCSSPRSRRPWRKVSAAGVVHLHLHRLNEERGDLAGRYLVLEHIVELFERSGRCSFLIHLPAERPRVRGDEDRADQWVIALPILGLRCRVGHRAHRSPVEAAAESDDALTTACLAASFTAPSTASAPEFIGMNDSMPSGVTWPDFSAQSTSER